MDGANNSEIPGIPRQAFLCPLFRCSTGSGAAYARLLRCPSVRKGSVCPESVRRILGVGVGEQVRRQYGGPHVQPAQHGKDLRTRRTRVQQQITIALGARMAGCGANAYLAVAGCHHRRSRILRIPKLQAHQPVLRSTGNETFDDLFHVGIPEKVLLFGSYGQESMRRATSESGMWIASRFFVELDRGICVRPPMGGGEVRGPCGFEQTRACACPAAVACRRPGTARRRTCAYAARHLLCRR